MWENAITVKTEADLLLVIQDLALGDDCISNEKYLRSKAEYELYESLPEEFK